jgi:hypothetical protein
VLAAELGLAADDKISFGGREARQKFHTVFCGNQCVRVARKLQ